MPNKFTEHYHLSQWEKTDQVLMEDFNADNLAIDAALKAEADANAALSASLTSEIQTRAALSSTVTKLGNCQIYTTTYTGKGTAGASNPIQLSFSYPPALVVVYAPNGAHLLLARNSATAYNNDTPVTVSWSGNRVSWYASGVLYQMNVTVTVLLTFVISRDPVVSLMISVPLVRVRAVTASTVPVMVATLSSSPALIVNLVTVERVPIEALVIPDANATMSLARTAISPLWIAASLLGSVHIRKDVI